MINLKKVGLKFEITSNENIEDIFSGISFVLTGTLKNFSREEAKIEIEKRGGRVLSSVSSKTSYLLTGDSAGSKFDKAKKMDVKILSEDDFNSLIGN